MEINFGHSIVFFVRRCEPLKQWVCTHHPSHLTSIVSAKRSFYRILRHHLVNSRWVWVKTQYSKPPKRSHNNFLSLITDNDVGFYLLFWSCDWWHIFRSSNLTCVRRSCTGSTQPSSFCNAQPPNVFPFKSFFATTLTWLCLSENVVIPQIEAFQKGTWWWTMKLWVPYFETCWINQRACI